ncbi:C6 transcription factor [Verticillium dahliae]
MLRQDSRPSLAIPKTRVSKRAAVACTAFACSLRKVRCTVALSGPPCANCAVDDTPCEISRAKGPRNLDLQPSLAHASGNEEASSAASTSSFSRVPIALPPATFASPSVKESSRLTEPLSRSMTCCKQETAAATLPFVIRAKLKICHIPP